MFGRKTEGKPPSKIDSLIGAGTVIEGNLRFAGGLRVDGEIKGNVEYAESGSAWFSSSARKRRSKGRR